MRQQFRPGAAGMLVNPFYFARRELFRHVSAFASAIHGAVLDVGCGQKPYADLFKATRYVGLEIDSEEARRTKKADAFYDGTTFPFADGEFDSVVTNQVFEHVFTPELFLQETKRVLKNNGTLLMTVPFVWDEHEQPYDFARYSSFGLKALLERNGFEIVEHRKSVNDIRIVFQLLNAYLYKKMMTSSKIVNLLLTIFIMGPVNITGEIVGFLLPKNDDLYLDNVVLARKVADE